MARRPAGFYIHPITVSQYTQQPAASGSGQLVPTKSSVCNRYAGIETPMGKEVTLPEGHQQLGINMVTLCVPWDSITATINSKMVVTYDGSEYEITASRDVTGRREEITIEAIQRVD